MLFRRPCSAVLVALLGIALVGVAACSSPTLLSTNELSDAPSVDASLAEWGPRLTPVKGDAVSMAALPTDSLLYVSVLVRDGALVQTIAQHGLIVWVDPAGQRRRTYGIQYPLGLRRQQAGRPSTRRASALEAVSLDALEVLRGDTLRRRIPARFSSGLRGAATLDPGSLICELAIPLDPSAKHGLPRALSSRPRLGLETPVPDAEPAPPESDDDLSVTERGGRQPERRRRSDRTQSPSPTQSKQPTLDLWVTFDATAP